METPRFHPDTIEDVKQRVDLVDVVSDYVVLRKRGKDYVGSCPFHEEKTPSFSVSPSKQLYYCFGCGTGGNAFKFLMELGKRSFSEVVLDLAGRYQVPIKTLEPQQRQELQRQLSLREQLYEILALTTNFYQHALQQPQGETALQYVKTKRQVREETVEQFQLGYSPAGWETLYRYLVEQKRYAVTLVEQAGLIKPRKSGHGYYDQFRDRLMIPIKDPQGRVIGFGSRTLTGEEPKYLNSPETVLFDKGRTLFALYEAKSSIIQQDQAIIVEGYFDAIALHEKGIINVVASLGTALSQHQLKLLMRYTESKQAILNFDADKAGTVATLRAIEEVESLVYSGQVQLRILNLPEGKDADEYLKSSPNASQQYRQQIQAAPLWIDWQIQQLLLGQDLKQADRFQQVTAQLTKLIGKIDKIDLRTYYTARCAELLSGGEAQYFKRLEETLRTQVDRQRHPRTTAANVRPISLPITAEKAQLEQAEALLLRLYMHCPQTRKEIIEVLECKDLLFSLSHHRFLWQQILQLEAKAQPGTTADRLLGLLQESSLEYPDLMAQVAPLFYLDEKTREDLSRTSLLIQAAIASLEQVACEKHKRYCYEQWQKLDPAKEPERWQFYYGEYYTAKKRILELDAQRQFSRFDITKNS